MINNKFHQIQRSCLFGYTIGPSTLERVDSIADLGVILYNKMSFRSHIDLTIAKGSAMLGFIKRLSSEFRDPYTLKALYVSLVRSRLEYFFVFGSLLTLFTLAVGS
jgi:hypothetical protein